MSQQRPDAGPATPAVRAAVIDDDTIVREGLAFLLDGVTVVARYERPGPLLADRPDVDLVILDLNLNGSGADIPGYHGSTAVRTLHQAGYRVLIYTNENRRFVLAGCLAAGARGIVHKTEPLRALATAAHLVAGDEVVISTALVGLAELVERRAGIPQLSPRQREVLAGRARGLTFRRISRQLGITEGMAHEHMNEVKRKFADYLQTHSPADLQRLLGTGAGDLLD